MLKQCLAGLQIIGCHCTLIEMLLISRASDMTGLYSLIWFAKVRVNIWHCIYVEMNIIFDALVWYSSYPNIPSLLYPSCLQTTSASWSPQPVSAISPPEITKADLHSSFKLGRPSNQTNVTIVAVCKYDHFDVQYTKNMCLRSPQSTPAVCSREQVKEG